MATSIYQQRLIDERKSNGLCIGCGKELDRDGVHCTSCREKINQTTRDRRHWYQENGICPRCGKVSLMGDEKACPECRAKDANRASRIREEKGETYNEEQRIYQKNAYEIRKKHGICTRCGKRKSNYGYKSCGICRAKDRERKRIKYGKTNRSERVEKGLCYFCDSPVKAGYKVCEKHYQMNLQKLDNDKCKKAAEEIKKIEHRRINNSKGSVENEQRY